jgi:plastocyanin
MPFYSPPVMFPRVPSDLSFMYAYPSLYPSNSLSSMFAYPGLYSAGYSIPPYYPGMYSSGYYSPFSSYSSPFSNYSSPYSSGYSNPYAGYYNPFSSGYSSPYSSGYTPSSGYSRDRADDANDVRIYNDYFNPKRITVTKGTTVHWTNKSSHRHTVTSDTGLWESGELDPGGTYSRTFNETGTYPYHCAIHPLMKAEVVVK